MTEPDDAPFEARLGHGWRLVAFDSSTRCGEVALRGDRLAFDARAAADEDLRIGDEVFVRLQSADRRPHVVRVWPCVARVRMTPTRAEAPPLDPEVATGAASAVGRFPKRHRALLADEGGGSVLVVACEIERNAYGLGGADVTVGGALRCRGARATREGRVDGAEVRLAEPEERALAHADDPVAMASIVISIPERRDPQSPTRAARVVLVTCDEVEWIDPPRRERILVAETALLALAPFTQGVRGVNVEGDRLVARIDGRDVSFFDLERGEGRAFVPVCAAWSAVLRGGDEDEPRRDLEAEQALARATAQAGPALSLLPLPARVCPSDDVVRAVLCAVATMVDALGRWLAAMDDEGRRAAPRSAVLSDFGACLGRVSVAHDDLRRAGAELSPRWEDTIDLVVELQYLGGTHGGGSLLSRLHDGRRWSAGDLEALRDVQIRLTRASGGRRASG